LRSRAAWDRVWAVPHAVALKRPDLATVTIGACLFTSYDIRALEELAYGNDLEASSKIPGAAAMRASAVCTPSGDRRAGLLWRSVARV
jgi:hypothetical protein